MKYPINLAISVVTTVTFILGVFQFSSEASGDFGKGSFPVENFLRYGEPLSNRPDGTFHPGLVIEAKPNSWVRNFWGGEVVEIYPNSEEELCLSVKSGKWLHSYCNLGGQFQVVDQTRCLTQTSKTLCVGQLVFTGTRLAKLSGTQLQWIMKYDGEFVDPGLVLREMYQRQAQIEEEQRRLARLARKKARAIPINRSSEFVRACQRHAQNNRLNFPETARFSGWKVDQQESLTRASGYVVATNAFGVPIRNNLVCIFSNVENNLWFLENAVFRRAVY